MILQAVSVLMRKTITVAILPLDQIGVQQAEYITNIGGKACFLNADTINEEKIDQLKAGMYTHVLMSPEMAMGDRFRPVAKDPVFKQARPREKGHKP